MKKLFLYAALASSSFMVHAIESMDGYYSNDLLGAVDEAKEKPHHYDYSNTYRYKRTTAQSIDLNRINLNELEETHLSMSAQGNDDTGILEVRSNGEFSQGDQRVELNKIPANSTFTNSSFILQNTGVARSTNGATSSSGILNQSTLISTPRP